MDQYTYTDRIGDTLRIDAEGVVHTYQGSCKNPGICHTGTFTKVGFPSASYYMDRAEFERFEAALKKAQEPEPDRYTYTDETGDTLRIDAEGVMHTYYGVCGEYAWEGGELHFNDGPIYFMGRGEFERFETALKKAQEPEPEPYTHHRLMEYFTSLPFKVLARSLDRTLPDGPEKTVALRKLLESMDAARRTGGLD